MRKLLYLLIIPLLLLTSCFDYKELKNVSFCFGMSIDYNDTEEKYLFNIETEIIENHISETNFAVTIHETSGNNFKEAYANLSATTSGLIDFSHCQLIVISQDIEFNDLKFLMSSLFNNTMIPNSVAILISTASTAREILSTKSITNASLSFEIIYALKENSNYYNGTFKKTITEVYNDLNSLIGNFLLPTVYVKEIKEQQIAVVSGAVLYNSFQPKGIIEGDELRNILFTEKKINTLLYNLKINNQVMGIAIDPYKRKVKITENSSIEFYFEFTIPLSITNPTIERDEVTELFKEHFKEDLINTFNYYKEQGIDIFNLKTFLYKHEYRLYNNSNKISNIKNYQIDVTIKTKIKETGIVR